MKLEQDIEEFKYNFIVYLKRKFENYEIRTGYRKV